MKIIYDAHPKETKMTSKLRNEYFNRLDVQT